VADERKYLCPVCGYDGLFEPAHDALGTGSDEICPCCGVQFGYDDARRSHAELRADWVQRGMTWRHHPGPPPDWDPARQLANVLE